MQTRNLILSTAAALLLSAPLAAQPHGPRGGGSPAQIGSATTVHGTVVAFVAGPGEGSPRLVVSTGKAETTYVLGPYRVLAAQGFSAAAGDSVELVVHACASCETGVAVGSVRNLTRGLTLTLRDATGQPTWTGAGRGGQGGRGGRGGPGDGSCAEGVGNPLCAGPDLARTAILTGTVLKLEGGFGSGQPTVTLRTSDGDRAVVVAPFRALNRAGLVPAEGMRLEIAGAPVVVEGVESWVALSVKDLATGLTVSLRDGATGRPSGCKRS